MGFIISTLKYLFLAYAWAGMTFFFFVAIITIKNQWMKLPLFVKVICLPWAILGVLSDVFLNLVFSWVFLLSVPKEFLFTAHCDRLLGNVESTAPTSWAVYRWIFITQGTLAREWCAILNLFDPGHCKQL